MARAYYSTVLDAPAERVWAVIRDFGNYRLWVDGVDESGIEDGRPGDAVGSVRFARMGETHIRQRLLAHSDVKRCYAYEFCGAPRSPVRDYRAAVRVTPVVDGGRSFVEWWADFDCAADEHAHWTGVFAQSFEGWLGSLRRRLAEQG
jgi:hypothetical protein